MAGKGYSRHHPLCNVYLYQNYLLICPYKDLFGIRFFHPPYLLGDAYRKSSVRVYAIENVAHTEEGIQFDFERELNAKVKLVLKLNEQQLNQMKTQLTAPMFQAI